MFAGLTLGTLHNFLIAILIGALIGIDREKRKAGEDPIVFAGLRTFIFFALFGATCAWLTERLDTPLIFVLGLGLTALTVVVGFVVESRVRPESIGMTTELAALITYCIGGVAQFGHPSLAIVLGIATASVLSFKTVLHKAVSKLGWDDIYAGLRLLIATFIVLPLLPNEVVDPLGAINPYKIWLLVILIASISLVGYIAARAFGARRGIIVAALSGALVSSTAVTLTLAKRSTEKSATILHSSIAGGILLAWAVMFARVLLEVAVVNTALVPALVLPLGGMGLVALAAGFVFLRNSGGPSPEGALAIEQTPLRNPFSLASAGKFAAFFTLILIVVKLAELYFPAGGIYAVAALAGINDVDAITLSMAELAKAGDERRAVIAIVIAAVSNTVTKFAMVATLGSTTIRPRLAFATALIVIVGISLALVSS